MADSITIVTDNTGAAAAALAAMAAYEGNPGAIAPTGGTTVTTPPAVNYFPTDPTTAPFPSPSGSVSVINAAGVPVQPYLRDAQGLIHTLGAVVMINGVANGNAWMFGGTAHLNASLQGFAELIIDNAGRVWAALLGGQLVGYLNGNNDWVFGTPVLTAPVSGGTSTGTAATLPAAPPAAPSLTSPPAPSTATGTLALTGIATMAAGSTIELPAGTVTATATLPVAGTINGAGMGKTIIDGTGPLTLSYGKALLVPLVPGTVIANVTLQNAACSDNNGAGVRDAGDGMGGALYQVEITGCQDGMLTFASDWNLVNCSVHGNGFGDGLSHELYFSRGASTVQNNTVALTNTNATCGPKSTHALKSRAGTTIVTGGVLTGSADPTGNIGGSVIDIPDCGIAVFSGTTATLAAGTANTVFVSYGSETGLNLPIGKSLTLLNFVANDLNGKGGSFEAGPQAIGATLTLAGCTYTGPVAPTFTGWASVIGAFTKAA